MTQSPASFTDIQAQEPSALSTRDKILRSALMLFNKHGVHTTGIDRIIAESDVAKMTFYKHFPSKTDLILAYLDHKHRLRFSNLEKHTTAKTDDPAKQLLGIFDSLKEWFEETDFNGCPFVRGLTDFGDDKDSPTFRLIESHFEQWSSFIEERLSKLLTPAKVKPALTQFLSLIVGSIALSLATRDPNIAQANKKLAESILKAASRKRAA